MKQTTNVKGQLAVSKAELRAFELGYIPSRPLFDSRYDLIIDDSKKLKRIQIKYADGKLSNTDGSVRVKLEYNDRTKHRYTYQEGETDGLIVYIPKIDKLCFFPPEIYIGKRDLCVRITPTKNRQSKKILLAEKYFW
jgi:hypothetical protein